MQSAHAIVTTNMVMFLKCLSSQSRDISIISETGIFVILSTKMKKLSNKGVFIWYSLVVLLLSYTDY